MIEHKTQFASLDHAFEEIPARATAYADRFHVYQQADLIEELYNSGESCYEYGINALKEQYPEAVILSHQTYYWNVKHRSALAGVGYAGGGALFEDDDFFIASRAVENVQILRERSIKTSLSYVALTNYELCQVTSGYFRLGAEDKLLSLEYDLKRGEKI